jgi:drug/metabolite transporter (DMT)-like permease
MILHPFYSSLEEVLDMAKKNFTLYILMLITALFWALGHPFGRIILRTVHPFQLGAINLIVGFFGLVIFLVVSGKIKELFRLSLRDFLSSLFLGVFGFLSYQIFTFSALARIPASMNAVLVSTNVVFIAIFSAVFLREKIHIAKIVGIIFAFTGVVIVTFNRGFSLDRGVNLVGCLFSLCAAVSFALYSILGKRLLSRNDPLITATPALFSGAVLLTVFSAASVGFRQLSTAPGLTWFLMIFLGITMIGIAYPLWFFCLKELPASHVSIYIYMTPVFAVILSLIILKERFAWLFWLGGALVLGGIVVASVFRAKTER